MTPYTRWDSWGRGLTLVSPSPWLWAVLEVSRPPFSENHRTSHCLLLAVTKQDYSDSVSDKCFYKHLYKLHLISLYFVDKFHLKCTLSIYVYIYFGTHTTDDNNDALFRVLFLQIGAHSPSHSKEQNTVKTNFCKHTHTHSQQDSLRGKISKTFKRGECVWWSNLAREFPDRWCSIRKDLRPSECMCTEGRLRMEVPEEKCRWWVGL